MTDSFILHDDRLVSLTVLLAHNPLQSPEVEEILGQFQIVLLTRDAVHLHQSHLHNLMSRFVGQPSL